VAFVRTRRGKRGVYYLVVDYVGGRKISRSAGRNRALAHRWAGKLTELKVRRRAGLPDSDGPAGSHWTLATLRDRDLADAAARGLELRARERRWRIILRYLGDLPLDALTSSALDAFARQRTAGPATINRDLSVLSAALRLARRLRAESGYEGRPDFPHLEERRGRKRAIALDPEQAARFVGICWRLHPRLAAQVELMLLTAQRPRQRPIERDGVLYYPAQKGGNPRSFPITGRLAEILALPRGWSRRAWTAAVRELGIPIRPYDLRHTAATLAGYEGRSVPAIQELLGHRSPRMASEVYLHVHPRLTAPVALPRANSGLTEVTRETRVIRLEEARRRKQ